MLYASTSILFFKGFLLKWARGGTGIRVRLRSVSRKGWEFKSPRAHLGWKFITHDELGLPPILPEERVGVGWE